MASEIEEIAREAAEKKQAIKENRDRKLTERRARDAKRQEAARARKLADEAESPAGALGPTSK